MRFAVYSGVGLILAGLSGCSERAASSQPRPAADAGKEGAAPAVSLAQGAVGRNPVATVQATRKPLAADLQLVGSVSYDQDHFAVVGPIVDGRVAALRARVGDVVRQGEVLAEIESTEIGQATAAYLSAKARAHAAETNLKREQELAAQKISSEREREMAEAQAVTEAAEQQAAIQRLRALGLGPAEIEQVSRGGGTGSRVPLRAPIGGTIITRLITLGQAVERADDAFQVADLKHLWVLLEVYEKDLNRVHVGQKVQLRTEAWAGQTFAARVGYVTPVIDEKTRTASVRIEFDNPQGKLRPGEFVTARLLADAGRTATEVLAIPRSAVQRIEGKTLVFVRTERGFERRGVETGLSGGDEIEIVKGLEPGEEVATEGAFLLKSELLR